MSLKINVEDRVPTYPGRVVLTPVAGAENTFDMTRADLPVNPGTPINKVLFDSKADRVTKDVIVSVSPSGSDITGTGDALNPFKTIQAAIDAVPKNLDGHTVTIELAPGEYTEYVVCKGFTGGILAVGAGYTGVFIHGIEVDSCSCVKVDVPNIAGGSVSVSKTALLHATNGSLVYVPSNIMIQDSSSSGIQASLGSTICFGYNTTTRVSNCQSAAVVSTSGSRVCLYNILGAYDTFGLTATMGGTITHGPTNDITSDFGDNEQDGGRIFTNS